MNRSQMGVIIVSIDIICACVYILSLVIISNLLLKDSERDFQNILQTNQFAVEITNLPLLNKEYPLDLLRVDLQE